MQIDERRSWTWAIIAVGAAYFIVGLALGYLAGLQESDQRRFALRLAAWIISFALFASHFLYLHFRLRNSPRITAVGVSFAVALGAFLLAVGALANTLIGGHGNLGRIALALVLWPLITAIPSLVVGFVSAKMLVFFQTRSAGNA